MESASSPPAPLDLERIPLDCLAEVIARLGTLRNRFAFARTCRHARDALLSRPICGLPVLAVDSVVCSGATYYITYKGLAEVDRLETIGSAITADSLIARFCTHFLVVFTYDHPFLFAWCRAQSTASSQRWVQTLAAAHSATAT
jgi:hypothetical protein